jgi:hypothetical protein
MCVVGGNIQTMQDKGNILPHCGNKIGQFNVIFDDLNSLLSAI